MLIGGAVSDALGVPVEFKSREYLKAYPVTGMIGYGTHNQLAGTFSDDSSLTFCLVEALSRGYDLNSIANNFVRWKDDGWWTANGVVFDIGIGTYTAIMKFKQGVAPDISGGEFESDNGNGSLMRIAPLLFYIYHLPVNERFRITKEVSSISHRHIRSVLACFYLLEFQRLYIELRNLEQTYAKMQIDFSDFLATQKIISHEVSVFDRILKANIYDLPEESILSSGYVIHTLEAALWCLFNTKSFESAVLQAVNLGNDTDTTAAVTGSLAGLIYGYSKIPACWIEQLARKDDIFELANSYFNKIKTYSFPDK